MNYIFGDAFLTIVYTNPISELDSLSRFDSICYEFGGIKYKFYNLKLNKFNISADVLYTYFLECFNRTQRNFILYGSHSKMVFITSNTKINYLSNKTSHYILSQNNYNIKFNTLNEMKFNIKDIHNTVYNIITIYENNTFEIILNKSSKVLYKYLYSKPELSLLKKCLSVYLICGPRFRWEKYKEFNENYLTKLNIPATMSKLVQELSQLIYNKKKDEIPTTSCENKNKMLIDLCDMISPGNLHLSEVVADYIFDITIIDVLLSYF